MDIGINADVLCHDELVGHVSGVIIDPVAKEVTHFVLKDREIPHIERLVPLKLIEDTSSSQIRLSCDWQDLRELDDFTELKYVQSESGYFDYRADAHRLWPYVMPDEVDMPDEVERIPPGELTISRGAEVRDSSDHKIGTVDEFLIDPASGHITHLVLREGHLWGRKDVTIPLSEIKAIEVETVRLKVSKEYIEKLPTVPIRRTSS
jgi:sporulation protein YlmC with PRC-barrel domain